MGPICPNCNSPEYYAVDVVLHDDHSTELVIRGGFCTDCGGLQDGYDD